ncbi:Transmembrane protein [Hirschfeldia incana]|nr:Transmembrane protein [Hirschfeldia incana]
MDKAATFNDSTLYSVFRVQTNQHLESLTFGLLQAESTGFYLEFGSDMNWVQRKIYLYNVTFGLYMLDWWERYLFNGLVVVLMWFVAYNGTRYFSELVKRHLT